MIFSRRAKVSSPTHLVPIGIIVFIVVFVVYQTAPERVNILPVFPHGSLSSSASPPKPPQPLPPAKVEWPKKIWQSWKTSVSSLDPVDRGLVHTWHKLNPEYRYELLTDRSAETYVKDSFKSRPEIVETYMSLRDPILRADMLRYMILLMDGGVYSDIDVQALKGVDDWIPSWYEDQVNLVVGLEVDELHGQKLVQWKYNVQMCQWTMMAKPGHPIMETVVRNIITSLWNMADAQNTTLSHVKLSKEDIIAITGPGAYTDAVFSVLSEQEGRNVSGADVDRIKSPKLFGDVLVLPVNAFGAGQFHSDSGTHTDDDAFVKHNFKGSWWKGHEDNWHKPKEPEKPKVAEKPKEAKKPKQEDKPVQIMSKTAHEEAIKLWETSQQNAPTKAGADFKAGQRAKQDTPKFEDSLSTKTPKPAEAAKQNANQENATKEGTLTQSDEPKPPTMQLSPAQQRWQYEELKRKQAHEQEAKAKLEQEVKAKEQEEQERKSKQELKTKELKTKQVEPLDQNTKPPQPAQGSTSTSASAVQPVSHTR